MRPYRRPLKRPTHQAIHEPSVSLTLTSVRIVAEQGLVISHVSQKGVTPLHTTDDLVGADRPAAPHQPTYVQPIIPAIRQAGEKCTGIESPVRLPAFENGNPPDQIAFKALARCGQLVQVIEIAYTAALGRMKDIA